MPSNMLSQMASSSHPVSEASLPSSSPAATAASRLSSSRKDKTASSKVSRPQAVCLAQKVLQDAGGWASRSRMKVSTQSYGRERESGGAYVR